MDVLTKRQVSTSGLCISVQLSTVSGYGRGDEQIDYDCMLTLLANLVCLSSLPAHPSDSGPGRHRWTGCEAQGGWRQTTRSFCERERIERNRIKVLGTGLKYRQ